MSAAYGIVAPPPIRPPRTRSLGEVAEHLRMPVAEVERLVRRGPITARFVNGELLIRESDLARFIASRRRS